MAASDKNDESGAIALFRLAVRLLENVSELSR